MSKKRRAVGNVTNLVLICLAVVVFLGCIAGGCYGIPKYRVWQQGLAGEADLRRAEMDRKIRVREAEAEAEAAKLLATAELERAKGAAAAIDIIGQKLTNNEAYLRYRWIEGLHNEHVEIIYVPTEANLPILEAGRFGKQTSQE